MRDVRDYSFGEWLKAEPLAHGARRLRNIAVDRVYGTRRAAGQDQILAQLAPLKGHCLAVTIAFNLPEAIALLSQTMAQFLPGQALLVCDNSSDAAARARIARICADRGHIYCALPTAPRMHGRPNGSRSHAVALNWVWRNLIVPTAPKIVALLDHDLVPLAPDDLAARVRHQPLYGMVRHGTRFGGWYLWPGYCVFDLTALGGGRLDPGKLDFGTDTPRTLDTGGQNWRVLYRSLALDTLARGRTQEVYLSDADGERESYLMVDGWLHVGGAGHRGGGAAALQRVRAAYEADPSGLHGRLVATGVAIAS